jgi:phenylacetate-coenzyme A ligase PaaK-like adenylate-forming protein
VRRIPSDQFRVWVKDRLGIPPEDCMDVYGMVEGNGWMTQCREGHYFHIPTCYFKPMVLDSDYKPLGYGQWGRFAFLDAAAHSYPGFMATGDLVKMLERCPACDRTGPVLEAEIKRAVGEEMRGCGEEVRNLVSSDLGG